MNPPIWQAALMRAKSAFVRNGPLSSKIARFPLKFCPIAIR